MLLSMMAAKSSNICMPRAIGSEKDVPDLWRSLSTSIASLKSLVPLALF
jgi:hypothetical protein